MDIIQVDEPFFSVDYPPHAGELLDELFSGLDKDTVPALHVCGDISGIVDKLMDLPRVLVLDHEFARNPGLLDLFDDFPGDKMIGLGCLKSDDMEVESVSSIRSMLRRGYDIFGPKMMIDPDCGLRHLSREVARKKLGNMVKAAEQLKEEI